MATVNYNGTEIESIRLHDSDVLLVKFIEDGAKIVSVSKDGVVKLWDKKISRRP